ncbi:MAG: TetR/AcrR family transcriptional regulator, partial [Thermoflavifilum sp.]|nr:TetR/AcrR family transcriptional regulator [Thermoflavifilum sp.]
MTPSEICQAYQQYWLEHGHRPPSVYAFAQHIGISEAEFYEHYGSFSALEKDFWKQIFDDTLQQLQQDETYQRYSAREKLLAFYYLWIQKLRVHRSYVLLQKNRLFLPTPQGSQLERFRNAFLDYVQQLIQSGIENKEIKSRKFFSDQYKYGFWAQLLFVLKYWIHDDSQQFELTDAA